MRKQNNIRVKLGKVVEGLIEHPEILFPAIIVLSILFVVVIPVSYDWYTHGTKEIHWIGYKDIKEYSEKYPQLSDMGNLGRHSHCFVIGDCTTMQIASKIGSLRT